MAEISPPFSQAAIVATRARSRRSGLPLWLALPALVLALVMALPLVYLSLRTLGAADAVWVQLWRPRTLQILVNSLLLALTVTAASTLISVPLAWLTVRTDLPLRRLWALLAGLPLVIPSYVAGYTLVAALGPRGLLQEALGALFGVTRLPEIYGFGGAALALTLCTYPYVFFGVRAALRGLDPACEEAARGLGQGAWTTFWRVTLPQLRPALGAGALLVALYTLSDFGAVALLQFDTFTRAIYVQYQASFDRVLAAAFALVLVGLTAIILMAEVATRGRARYARSGAGAARRPRRIRLGRWRWAALLFCGLVIGSALILPLSVLVSWCVRGLVSGAPLLPALLPTIVNSTSVALVAATVTVVASLPLATLSVRYPSRLGSLIERLTYAGYALPGIVVALALVFFGANYALALYQTLTMLIIGYLVRFLPQAVGATRAALLQINPHVEEAARGLGQSPGRVALMVTMPLARPGLLTGGALVFLTVMKELPITLLLSPIGFDTLATTIWQASSSAAYAQAAAPALLLVLVSAVPVALMFRREPDDV